MAFGHSKTKNSMEKKQKEGISYSHAEKVDSGTENSSSAVSSLSDHVNLKGSLSEKQKNLEHPLYGLSDEELLRRVNSFVDEHGFAEDREYFERGILLASNPNRLEILPSDERTIIEEETTHKWRNSNTLYYLACMVAMCAIVQGMDETVVNGAQTIYEAKFGLDKNIMLLGLVNGAPYLCCAVVGTFINEPLNRIFGRRGTIFISCLIAAGASIWEAFTYSWGQLFAARFVLGLGIGPKSSTAPVFTAECAPASIRGALVMMWQMWTAFGIMLGYVISLAFFPSGTISEDVSWRLMLGSTVVAPILVCMQVYFVPESPRWLLLKGRYTEAYQSMQRLRRHKIQAARDLYYTYVLLEYANGMKQSRNPFKTIFKVPRIRRAFIASELLMFMQQFCGVNVIAYYSSSIFTKYGFSLKQAFLASFGFGLINWLFALPAVYTIDTFGRRALLLFTFPFLFIFLLLTGFSFYIPDSSRKAKVGVVSLGIYLFTIFYSCGEGPVPFTYSAEAYPLQVRDFGMSVATGTTWLFNFILSLTWPKMLVALTPQGAFGFYAAWNCVAIVLVFLFVPETKGLTLEELDKVFSITHKKFIDYQFKFLSQRVERYILFRSDVPKPPPVHVYYENDMVSDIEKNAIKL